MAKEVIIADASPLIALADIGELEILNKLYQNILITDIVRAEVQAELPDWIIVSTEYDPQQQKLLELELDRGEASAIALALGKDSSRIIIDEQKGRSVARRLGLKITGTLGLIITAKEKGLITAGRPILEKLENHGFWLSEKLKSDLLTKLGE